MLAGLLSAFAAALLDVTECLLADFGRAFGATAVTHLVILVMGERGILGERVLPRSYDTTLIFLLQMQHFNLMMDQSRSKKEPQRQT